MPKKSGTVRLFIPVTHETHGYLQKLAAKLGVKPNQAYGIAISYGARMMLRTMELQERLSPDEMVNFVRVTSNALGGDTGRDEIVADTRNLLKATDQQQKPKPRPKRKK